MTTRTHKTDKPKGKSRLRAEIVEGARALHELGAFSDSDLETTTIRMLGRSALPRVEQL